MPSILTFIRTMVMTLCVAPYNYYAAELMLKKLENTLNQSILSLELNELQQQEQLARQIIEEEKMQEEKGIQKYEQRITNKFRKIIIDEKQRFIQAIIKNDAATWSDSLRKLDSLPFTQPYPARYVIHSEIKIRKKPLLEFALLHNAFDCCLAIIKENFLVKQKHLEQCKKLQNHQKFANLGRLKSRRLKAKLQRKKTSINNLILAIQSRLNDYEACQQSIKETQATLRHHHSLNHAIITHNHQLFDTIHKHAINPKLLSDLGHIAIAHNNHFAVKCLGPYMDHKHLTKAELLLYTALCADTDAKNPQINHPHTETEILGRQNIFNTITKILLKTGKIANEPPPLTFEALNNKMTPPYLNQP